MPVKFADVEGEYKKDKQLKKDDVRILREWLRKQAHLPNIEELKLILFLYASYCNIEKAKVLLENFYTARTHAPELFLKKDLKDKSIQQSMRTGCLVVLPHATDEGYKIIYGRMMDTDPDLMNFNAGITAFDMASSLYQMQDGISLGQIMILDSEGLTLAHAMKVNFATCMKLAYYLQDCFPHRLKAVHIINVSPITEKLFFFVKPLIKKEFVDITYFHPKINTLYNFVPRKLLPKEYGGESPCFQELHETSLQNVKDNFQFYAKESLEFADEKKRVGRRKTTADIFGMEGTFRKLEID